MDFGFFDGFSTADAGRFMTKATEVFGGVSIMGINSLAFQGLIKCGISIKRFEFRKSVVSWWERTLATSTCTISERIVDATG